MEFGFVRFQSSPTVTSDKLAAGEIVELISKAGFKIEQMK